MRSEIVRARAAPSFVTGAVIKIQMEPYPLITLSQVRTLHLQLLPQIGYVMRFKPSLQNRKQLAVVFRST